jgi:hypothetical protein
MKPTPRSSGISCSKRNSGAWLTTILITTCVLLAACATPNPDTAAGRSEVAGQKCTLCMVENPGDYDACHAICVQRVDDEAGYLRALGR